MKTVFTIFVFLAFSGINLFAQPLTGNKSIPGNYSTIADAIADLDTQGVGTGGVTFNVLSGHTEVASNLVISIPVDPPTESNPVVFQASFPGGRGANPLITAAPGSSVTLDGIIKLSGADYITFDGIDLLDPASNTGDAMMEWGYALLRKDSVDGSQHNVIKNCNITLQKINTQSIGIYIINQNLSGAVVAADTINGNTSGLNNNNKIYGCSISDVDIGIFAKSVTNIRDRDNEIGVLSFAANNITNWGGSQLSSGLSHGIRCEGQEGLKICNNNVNGGAGTGGSSSVVGIMVTSQGTGTNLTNYEISHNTVTVSTNPTSQQTWGIRALGNADTIRIHHNVIENCNVIQNTIAFHALAHDQVGTTNEAYIYENIIRNNTHTGTGVSTLLESSGIVGYLSIRKNQIYGNQKTGISGTMNCILAETINIDCDSNKVYNNSMPNSSGTGSSNLYGYINTNSPTKENVFDNEIYNQTVGGSNTSAASLNVGIRTNANAATIKDIFRNKIHGLSAVSGSGTTGGVHGIYSSLSASADIHSNKIYDLTNTAANSLASGIWVSSGFGIDIHDNLISDIKAPNSTNANGVIGINITSTTASSTVSVHDNSVYLTATGGATFGSSGISVTSSATSTTASLELNNNSFINLSTPGSTSGATVAYRRSTTSLANFALSSDNNNYYSGNPILPNKLIFFDGTNSEHLLAGYKIRVAPRDANATTEQFKTLNLALNLEACNMVDAVTVEIRESVSPFNLVDSVVALGGKGLKQVITLDNLTDGVSYYIVVKHRNSIETWSKTGGEMFTAGILSYEFPSAASQAFGDNMVLVDGMYSFYTGDVNQDGIVDLTDIVQISNDANNFVTGYVVTDLNCNDVVDLTDVIFAFNNSALFVNVEKP